MKVIGCPLVPFGSTRPFNRPVVVAMAVAGEVVALIAMVWFTVDVVMLVEPHSPEATETELLEAFEPMTIDPISATAEFVYSKASEHASADIL